MNENKSAEKGKKTEDTVSKKKTKDTVKVSKPNYIITIKKIKDMLLIGTNRKKYDHGEFVQMLLVDGSGLFDLQYFFNNILKDNGKTTSDSTFSNFVNGNIRSSKSGNWLYPSTNVADALKAKHNLDYDKGGNLLVAFTEAFDDSILPDLLNNCDNEIAYFEMLYNGIGNLISPENTYYKELFAELNSLINKKESLSKLLALLCLIALFQDNIYSLFPDKYYTRWSETGFFPHHPEIKPRSSVVGCSSNDRIPLGTNELFETILSDNSELGDISSIDMAFHGGALWLIEGKKMSLLTAALRKGIKFRILLNTADQVNTICSHMKQPDLVYVGFDEGVKYWHEFSKKHPQLVEVRISEIPLLRRTYIINGSNSKGWANITYYAYGHIVEECQKICYDNTSKAFALYSEEFDYIWNNASYEYQESSN